MKKTSIKIEGPNQLGKNAVNEWDDIFKSSAEMPTRFSQFIPVEVVDNKIDTLEIRFQNEYSAKIYSKESWTEIKKKIEENFIKKQCSWEDILNFLKSKFEIITV